MRYKFKTTLLSSAAALGLSQGAFAATMPLSIGDNCIFPNGAYSVSPPPSPPSQLLTVSDPASCFGRVSEISFEATSSVLDASFDVSFGSYTSDGTLIDTFASASLGLSNGQLSFGLSDALVSMLAGSSDTWGWITTRSDLNEPVSFHSFVTQIGQGGSTPDVVIAPDVSPVPLPAAGWLLFAGLGGLAMVRRHKVAAIS